MLTPHGNLRDYQQSRLYRWESGFLGPRDQSKVPFDNIQNIVNHIWEGEGLSYPPKVKPIPKQKTSAMGDACRLSIRFHEGKTVPTWVIIHEVAHSMTSSIEGKSAKHGPLFVGVYIKLLAKYLPGMNQFVLMHTAKEAKVDFDIMATPVFLDD